MNDQYNIRMHKYGRIFTVIGIFVMFMAPVAIWIITGVGPNFGQMVGGVIALTVFFGPGGFIEMVTYSPILGTSATYLAFITGNLINLKVPCVMNATEICKTKINTPENEVVAAISVAFSSITTVVILSLGVVMLIPLSPLLQSEVLAPAFNWVVSALFGALGYKYIKGNLKLLIVPFIIVIVLGALIPEIFIGNVSILIFVLALVTLLYALILFKMKKI